MCIYTKKKKDVPMWATLVGCRKPARCENEPKETKPTVVTMQYSTFKSVLS